MGCLLDYSGDHSCDDIFLPWHDPTKIDSVDCLHYVLCAFPEFNSIHYLVLRFDLPLETTICANEVELVQPFGVVFTFVIIAFLHLGSELPCCPWWN